MGWTHVLLGSCFKWPCSGADRPLVNAILRPLRLPGFGRLALTYTINEAADWLSTIALSVLVFDETGSAVARSEEHTSELQSRQYLVCRLLLGKKKQIQNHA